MATDLLAPQQSSGPVDLLAQSSKSGMVDMSHEGLKEGLQGLSTLVTNPAGYLSKAITGKTIAENVAGNQTPNTAQTPIPEMLAKNAMAGLGDVAENAANMGVYVAGGGLMAGAGKIGEALSGGNLSKLIDTHADVYRKILNPAKNILNAKNVDVDSAVNTLAKEGVIIKTDINNKLDNTSGIQQLQAANKPLYDQAQKILDSKSGTFDLDKIAVDAKANAGKYI